MRQLKDENRQLVNFVEENNKVMETRIKESVKECELMTKVLYEVLPI